MKYKIILKSLFVLILVFTFSFRANASEITGSLSSGGTNNTEQIDGFLSEAPNSPDTGSIGGSVSGGSSGGKSSGETPSGTSLSTSNGGGGSGETFNRLDSVAQNVFSSDNTALISNSGNLAFSNLESTQSSIADGSISNSSLIENDVDPQSQAINDSLPIIENPQTAQAINAFSGISTMSWVWISLILLLLITTVTFMYNRNKRFTRWNNV